MPNANRDPYQEYLNKRIAGSQFFGIDTIKDTSNDLPHMLPSPDNFADAVGNAIDSAMACSITFIYLSFIKQVNWESLKMIMS